MRTVTPKLVASAFGLATLAASGCASQAQVEAPKVAVASSTSAGTTVTKSVAKKPKVEMITPAQWLQRQPKPMFKPGHTMPRLTRYAYDLDVETFKELAGDWNYVVQTNYLSDEMVTNALKDPINDRWGKLVALSISNPKKYPLGVILDRSEPPNPAPETFLRGADGKMLNGSTYSPLNPQSVLDQMAELRARPLRKLRKKVPINIVLNGGEYGLGVPGFMRDIAARDPKVAAAQAKSGLDWISFISRAKGREMDTIADAVRKAVSDRSLYIYYQTGSGDRNRYAGWRDWGMDPEDSLKGSDLPSTEHYYKHFNTGYLSAASPYSDNDMLSRALNSTGFQIAHGKKYFYDWFWAGFIDEGSDGNGNLAAGRTPAPYVSDTSAPVAVVTVKAQALPKLQGGNAAALVDPTASGLSPMNLYTGFLKCIFTSGTLGGNAGYYYLPLGGFNGSFPANQPKYYLLQMTALSQVQALFSYLETDVRNSDLLPGPNKHAKSTDQPAYEFPTGDADTRVLARKLKTQGKWIITAWAADGVNCPVKVTIPVLGTVTLLARGAGSVYIATLKDKKPQLLLADPNAMTPTIKGFKPRVITEAQILSYSPKAPTVPLMNNLQVWFDAAKGIAKDASGGVTSWKPSGTLSTWQVNAKREGSKPLWVKDAANGLPAVRFEGERKGLFSRKLDPEPAFAGAVKTIFAVYATYIPTAYGGDGLRILQTSPAGEGAPIIFGVGFPPNPAKQTWQVKMNVTDVTATPEYLALGATVSKQYGGEGPQMGDRDFRGDLAEILIYRGALTPMQRFQVHAYLKAKYKLDS